MIIKCFKPFTPSLRNKINIKYLNIVKKNIKYLNYSNSIFTKLNIKYKNKKIYKKICFNYLNFKFNNIIFKILIINKIYDSNRNNLLYLCIYLNSFLKGKYIYKNMIKDNKIFDIISIGLKTDIKTGNSLLLNFIPNNIIISNLEYNNKCKFIRSAGTFGNILNKKFNKVLIKLPSKKLFYFKNNNFATIGQNDNKYYNLINKGKIYKNFQKKKIRGTAKNACDHPHGGGKGKSYIGCKYSMTPWNKKALGKKTKK